MNLSFSEQDIQDLQARGSDPKEVATQFAFFQKGFPYTKLLRPARLHDGIMQIKEEEIAHFLERYDTLTQTEKLVKFVPASGAASRMFKELFIYLESDTPENQEKASRFLDKLPDFPFYDDLQQAAKDGGYDLDNLIQQNDYKTVIQLLLTKKGLNYSNLPKALLKFHHYGDYTRYAIEEHLVEAAMYAQNHDHICHIHFTVSSQHQPLFEALIEKIKPQYEKRFNVMYDISFSIQVPSTDTLAATLDNTPFRDENGHLLFRPGGHGALIKNLNQIEGSLIFVKNIDNIITEDRLEATTVYKKILASILLRIKQKIHHLLTVLEHDSEAKPSLIALGNETFLMNLSQDITIDELRELFNRPIRVCGMVKNEGEPGGGPFWISEEKERASLQIMESSQINMQNPEQQQIAAASTHFNPVDMVCSIEDYQGNRFDLNCFIDEKTGFISEKSYGEHKLKAMELPGLWNGAMAHWLTIFVEVPLDTFNPVKTVFDLGQAKRRAGY